MTEEEKLEDSLAAWIPPWQRVTKPAPDATDDESDTDVVDESDTDVVDESDVDAESEPVGAGDSVSPVAAHGEIVDSLADLAYAPSSSSSVHDLDGEDHPDGLDEDDYLDVAAGSASESASVSADPLVVDGEDDEEPQRPENDVLTVAVDAAGGDDDEPQRPETDILTELTDIDGGEDEDDDQLPETDVLTVEVDGAGGDDDEPQRPETDFAKFAYPSTRASENAERAEPGANRPADLRGAVEAIMLVLDEPVAEDVLAGVLDVTTAEVAEELTALAADYNDNRRGFELRRAAGGWRLYTRGEFSAYVERFVLDGQSVRLTQAALETLAVVAYQQPVTRSRMGAIRGVNCDGVVRTLVSRGLIEECGTQAESGAFLYKTTQLFLEKLGLDSLEQLPSLAPFLPDDVNGLVDAER